jgi:hypothetical protein
MKLFLKSMTAMVIALTAVVFTVIPAYALNLPYNWPLWDGSRFDFETTIVVDSGYPQDPVSLTYKSGSLKAVSAQYATIILEASGGLSENYVHENNLGLAPYAFAWTETPAAPTLDYSSYGGYQFKAIDWFLAGKLLQGKNTPANILDVNEAIDNLIASVDLYGDGTPDTDKETKVKEYAASKRLQLGKTYYFHLIRFGGNALFSTSGYHAGPWNDPATPPTNFIRSAITTSAPITMPTAAETATVDANSLPEAAKTVTVDANSVTAPEAAPVATNLFIAPLWLKIIVPLMAIVIILLLVKRKM